MTVHFDQITVQLGSTWQNDASIWRKVDGPNNGKKNEKLEAPESSLSTDRSFLGPFTFLTWDSLLSPPLL